MARLVKTNLIQVNQKIEDKETFILFAYTDNCTPCDTMKNKLERWCSDKTIFIINISEYPELASQRNIMAVPTVIKICETREIDRVVGMENYWRLKTML